MGLIDIIKKQQEPQPTPPVDVNKLTQQEIQILLQMLGEASIKGSQIEPFYNLIVKLQNQFLEQSNK